jgi:Fe-S-cluster containining protein
LVSIERTCNRCGMCCSMYEIALTEHDLDREPELNAVSRPIQKFEREGYCINDKYNRIVNTIGSSRRCPFYKDGFGCSIYKSRPEICRDYIPTLSNCLKARMGNAGFNIEEWGKHCITEYCKTHLHRITGLRSSIDDKTI